MAVKRPPSDRRMVTGFNWKTVTEKISKLGLGIEHAIARHRALTWGIRNVEDLQRFHAWNFSVPQLSNLVFVATSRRKTPSLEIQAACLMRPRKDQENDQEVAYSVLRN